ncbi:MAG: YfhO family protein [Candidatus Binatia bacterium]
MTALRRARARTLGTAAGIAILAVVFWELRMVRPVALPQTVGRWDGDLYTIYYPSFVFAYRGAEFLPRWNPLQMAGVPFLGNYNGGFLYPPNWLAAVLPVHLALGWVCLLHVAFAGTATFAVGRSLGLSRAAAVVAAVTFMLSERFLLETYRPSYLAAIAWIPVVFLCAGRLVAAPTPWRGALLGAAVALQFLTGIAQHVCYEAYLLLLAGAVAWAMRPAWDAAYARQLVVGACVGAVVAVGLAAVQLVPTLEVVAGAVRGPGGLTLAQTYAPKTGRTELRQLAYIGGPVLGLAALGFVDWRRRVWVAPAVTLVVVAVLVGIGSPLYTHVFYRLPAVGLFRMPQQMAPLGTLALGLLAGLGVDVAMRKGRVWPLGARAVLGVGLGVAGAVAVSPALEGTWTAALVFVATVTLVVRPRGWSAWLLAAVLVCQRFVAIENRVMIPQNNTPEFFAPPPFVRFLQTHAAHDRVVLVKNWRRRFPYMEKIGTLWGIHVAQDYEPLVAAAYHAFLRPLERANVDRPLFAGRVQPRAADPAWSLLDLLAVRYVAVAAGRTWTPVGDRFRVVYQGPDATVYENTMSAPRAYLAERWRVMADPGFTLAALHGGRIDARSWPAVDRDDPVQLDPRAVGAGDVRIVGETNDTVTLHVTAPRGGLVVLADVFWPGWRVTVDGIERAVLRVNYLFRGVTVDPGEHEVRFRYVPLRLRIGAAVSGITALALVLGGIAVALDSRRRHPRLGAA